MVLELHVWGPAFELPSIDAQCLASIFYFRQCLHSDDWVLVPSSDPGVSAHGELPALRDGDIWVAGYSNIINYLRTTSKGKRDLDNNLAAQQQADCTALSAFIISRGQPLLDLCLYVSSDNYHDCTRPALAGILSWPNSWIIPQRLREQAKKRSEHLGLSSLDMDAAQEDEDKKENASLTAQIPKSLRKPRQTITSLLIRNQQRNRFRLNAVTEDFMEPLADILGDKDWLLGDHASSADCLAIGYLALMQTLRLKHGWLGESLRTKHVKLDEWARRQASQAVGSGLEGSSTLPLQVPAPRSFPAVCHEVLAACIGFLPVIGTRFSASEITYKHKNRDNHARTEHLQLARLQRQRDLYVEILASTVTSVGLGAWLLHKGMLRLPRWTGPGQSRRRFGEAGTLLGLG